MVCAHHPMTHAETIFRRAGTFAENRIADFSGRVFQQGDEGFAHELVRGGDAGQVEDRGIDVERGHQRVARRLFDGQERRMNKHRHAHGFLVHRDLVSKPVVAEKIAVVRKVDDDRVVIEALSLELPDQRADLAVQKTHVPVVGVDDLFHVGLAARRTSGRPGRRSRKNRVTAIPEGNAARRSLVEEALQQRRLAPVGIELDVGALVDVLGLLRRGEGQMRVARRDPEEKRTARLRLAGQKFFRLGKCLQVVRVMNLAAFSEAKRRRLAEVGFSVKRGVVTGFFQDLRQRGKSLVDDHILDESACG